MEYNFREIEKKWQNRWASEKTFKAENNSSKEKYYVLDMFPYPSGAGLHVGHPLGYIASDIIARFKRHCGCNVLHPMGYDSFGLPAEQYAIQTGQHPAITTEENIKRYRQQLDKIGFSFDWDREVRTSDPNYYKWTQWIFIKLFHSWYNYQSNKTEHIDTLIKIFEAEGFHDAHDEILTGNIEHEISYFSKEEWKNFSEEKKSEILMNFRIAYLGEAFVNWCPQLGTVLANDEVKDGVSERGGYPVERKIMKQWSMRITPYAQRLLDGLEKLEWSDSLKDSQRYWIGKSEGAGIRFKTENINNNSDATEIEVFTTRPDTIFGVTFLTLAPEHELAEKLITPENTNAAREYITASKNRSERERQSDVKKVSGVFTGSYAIHPFNGKKIPIWIGDYVLVGYGTGAVMGVPAHDSRDHAFALHFGIDIKPVIQANSDWDYKVQSFDSKDSTCINSEFLNGMKYSEASKRIIREVESNQIGKGKINFRLRDAVFGRQRYWGEPIPVYYKNDVPYTLPENELPLILPEIDKFLPTETGEPPLARATNWKYKGEFEYEHTTMPGWAGSSWYFLRYMDSANGEYFVSKESGKYWKNVDLYIGGSEHATGHLMYVRFWSMALFDLGFIPEPEPAFKLINQGMIQGTSCLINRVVGTNKFVSSGLKKNYNTSPVHIDVNLVENNIVDIEKLRRWRDDFSGAEFELEEGRMLCDNQVEKMGKRYHNVVNPDDMCEAYGADTLRLYEMFLGPLELSKPWNTNGITGVHSFLKKLWRLFYGKNTDGNFSLSDEEPTREEYKVLHKTIKKITEEISRFSFNTSVSNFMICVNELTDKKCNKRKILEPLLILISPYAPHIAEELWEKSGFKESITYAKWPNFDESYLVESSFKYPVSFNGKTRFYLELSLSLTKEEIEKEVLSREETLKYIGTTPPKKTIVVPNKIINIVT
ncbi:MAG: leucine--tRNA ligase [Bacteroidota bacterium]